MYKTLVMKREVIKTSIYYTLVYRARVIHVYSNKNIFDKFIEPSENIIIKQDHIEVDKF